MQIIDDKHIKKFVKFIEMKNAFIALATSLDMNIPMITNFLKFAQKTKRREMYYRRYKRRGERMNRK